MDDVLRYTQEKRSQDTVRRAYAKWRAEQGLPDRCDNDRCRFYTEPLIWNEEPFTPILDHIDGVNSNNFSTNLRYLCPICNSQLDTHGGGNKGRVEKAPGGFAHVRKDGLKDYTLPGEAGHYELRGAEAVEIIRVPVEPKKA